MDAQNKSRYVSRLTRQTLALALAGCRGSRLYELTDWRAKPAVPFGEKFRIIDFPLSNCVNSGIRRIGVLTQYKAHSLIRHLVQGWSYFHSELDEFVEILPASQRAGGESVADIATQHWQQYGRDYYTRHDYEAVASDAAESLMITLRDKIKTLTGSQLGNYQVETADDFSYIDPIDGSISQQQGIRVLLRDGSRIIYRLSGTGTEGATLRVYIEGHEACATQQAKDPQSALAELISLASELAKIEHFIGRNSPDVVT